MKVEIKIQRSEVITIDVELPYYYEQNIDTDYSDTAIYGRIEEKNHVSIKEDTDMYGKKSFEIEVSEHNSIKATGLGCYFNPKYSSNQNAFDSARLRVLKLLSEI